MSEKNYTTAPLPFDHPAVRHLIERHGELWDIDAVAKLFGTTAPTMRQRVRRATGPAAQALRAGRREFGRRVLYDVRYVAHVFEENADASMV